METELFSFLQVKTPLMAVSSILVDRYSLDCLSESLDKKLVDSTPACPLAWWSYKLSTCIRSVNFRYKKLYSDKLKGIM